MLSWVKIFFVLLPLALSACGFAPLYGEQSTINNTAVQQEFDRIHIENIPDREGQYLRNALLDRLYSQGRPHSTGYILAVDPVQERRADLDITKSSDATRAQLRLTTKMELKEPGTGRVLLTRKLTSVTSYNILQSQFTTRVSEENARQNALDELARQIETRLSLYFNRR